MRSRMISIWVIELRDLAYDVEDVLDIFATEQLQRKIKAEAASASTSKVRKLIPTYFSGINPRTLKFNAEMVSKVQEKLLDCRRSLQRKIIWIPMATKRLPTTSLVNESKVYGRDGDGLAILEILRANQSDKDVSVIPIIGMGDLARPPLHSLFLAGRNQSLI
ncbi:unnamed protein product [Linum tenue]|uniref:Disease resistance N-terminal domain-containing protein n=1 Tax=Linum tenue TaxID=586396 RepID=A0AAV0KFR3_9ROSI|nr:unnamed protein product [Linum tenue]